MPIARIENWEIGIVSPISGRHASPSDDKRPAPARAGHVPGLFGFGHPEEGHVDDGVINGKRRPDDSRAAVAEILAQAGGSVVLFLAFSRLEEKLLRRVPNGRLGLVLAVFFFNLRAFQNRNIY